MTHPQQPLIAKLLHDLRCAVTFNRCDEYGCRHPGATTIEGYRCPVCAIHEHLSAGAVPQPDLEPIKAREAAATKGPWRSMAAGNCSMEDGRLAAIAEVEGLPRPWNPVWVGWQNAKNYFKTFLRQADAEFIAHARRDVPMLIAEVERLRAGAVPQQEPQDRLWRALLYWERTKMALDAVRPDFTPDQLRELNAAEGRLLSVIEELRPAVPALPAPQEQDGKS